MNKHEILNSIKSVNVLYLKPFELLYIFFSNLILSIQNIKLKDRHNVKRKIIQLTIFIIIKPNCFCYFMNETTEWKNIFNLLS
jgi:hypothetical protein